MELNFKDVTMSKLQEYIGKKIYIIHPGIKGDPYWGTIDSKPPHLLYEIIKEFIVWEKGINLMTINGSRYDTNEWKIFFDEKLAQAELEKLLCENEKQYNA